jgi:hypothetical protein
MSQQRELLKQLAREVALSPQEQLRGRRVRTRALHRHTQGVAYQEHRVPLTPGAVAVLTGGGN